MSPEGEALVAAASRVFALLDNQIGDTHLTRDVETLRRFFFGALELPITNPSGVHGAPQDGRTRLAHDLRDLGLRSASWTRAESRPIVISIEDAASLTKRLSIQARKPLTRDALPPTVRDLCNAAVRMRLIDPVGLALLVHQHGADHEALLRELDDIAADSEAEDHAAASWKSLHAAVVWLTEIDDGNPPSEVVRDFRDRTREKMQRITECWAVRV